MEWYNGLACVTYKELTDGDPEAEKVEDRPVMSVFTYRNLTTRGDISVLRRACYGQPGVTSRYFNGKLLNEINAGCP